MVTTWFGVFIMDGGRVESSGLFPADAWSVAERLRRVGAGVVLDEERALAAGFVEAHGEAVLKVEEQRLAELGDVEAGPGPLPDPGDYGFDPSLLRDATLALGGEELQRGMPGDWHVMQAVDTLDELTRAMNSLAERMRVWYSPHWPELEKAVDDHAYAFIMHTYGTRDGLIEAAGSGGEEVAEGDDASGPHGDRPSGLPDMPTLTALAGSSSGCELDGELAGAVDHLAASYLDLAGHRSEVEENVRTIMGDVAPELAALAGPLVGARLIRLAGGLDRMARLPSSTIQMLGAEKALFSHLREGTKPPKHGVIFQHPLVHSASWWQRGRIARSFAGKISIAVRSDRYGGETKGEDLLAEVTARAEEVRRELPEPPKGRSPPPERRDDGGRGKGRGGRAHGARKGGGTGRGGGGRGGGGRGGGGRGGGGRGGGGRGGGGRSGGGRTGGGWKGRGGGSGRGGGRGRGGKGGGRKGGGGRGDR